MGWALSSGQMYGPSRSRAQHDIVCVHMHAAKAMHARCLAPDKQYAPTLKCVVTQNRRLSSVERGARRKPTATVVAQGGRPEKLTFSSLSSSRLMRVAAWSLVSSRKQRIK